MSEDPTTNTSAAPPAADAAPSVEYTANEGGGGESNFVEAIKLPTPEEIRGQDIWNNCAVRSVASGVMGGGLGLAMGLFLGALDNPIMHEVEMTGRQQFIYTAKQMGRRSWGSCKAFAVMGFIFSAAECVVEKARAKHDMTNTVVAGCATGGTLSAKGGPKAACIGCAGFAAFSVVIEKFLDRHE
ncbi:mitochondrial import inner membrane translocase subunit TIM22-4 [Artemisia annua]|uniref:Mitochondrial import inner membrane translocase subunit TIM22-4 n=1 Tax=Artemisia annua TaxID=35608 RepID=A0A2U1M478_ARTAN|nr:mitochondrial import inner membrane translocase subunit TIM22-4 [Artemisia annua]